MNKNILICNPGTPASRWLYAQALERLGLMPHVKWMLQVGTTIKDQFPQDFKDDFGRVGKWAYADTLRALAMYPQDEPYTHCMYDYEEVHRGYNWMLEKLSNGYDDDDNAFVHACLRGMQEALPDASRSWYNTPILTDGLTTAKDVRNLLSLDVADEFGWVWHRMYPTNKHLDGPLTEQESTELALQNYGQYTLKAKLRKPVATMMFLHYHMPVADVAKHTNAVLESTHPACEHVGIWSDLRSATQNQIERLEAVAPALLEWIGG